MKITAPHLGHMWLPLKTLQAKTGIELIEPPLPSRRTIALGVQHSPEWMCFPFKVILGNFLEAIEGGADTLLMAEGPQLCRLGYYARLYEQVLAEMGYSNVKVLTFNWQEQQIIGLAKFLHSVLGDKASWTDILGHIKHALQQLVLIEDIEQRVQYLRPRAQRWGAIQAVWQTADDRVARALNGRDLGRVKREIFAELDAVPLNPDAKPLQVGILGEWMTALDPFYNFDIEVELGRRGVEVHRRAWIAGWAKVWLFFAMVGLTKDDEIQKAAAPYLKRDVSGDGLQSIGETVVMADKGYDGIVHLQPFTCLPEVVAHNILPKVLQDHDIPVLELIIDEQTAKTGVLTRVEAFVDLMARRRTLRTVEARA